MKHSKDDIKVGKAMAEMLPHHLQLNTNVEQKTYSKIIRRETVFYDTHNKVSGKDGETGKLNGEGIRNELTSFNSFGTD
jgi:hypothetical protein